MDTQLILNACSHPKLASWRDIFSQAHCYQCMSCGEEIDIPLETIRQDGTGAAEAGIVGLTFGDVWREKLQAPGEMARRWPDEIRIAPHRADESRYFPQRRAI